MHACVYFHKVHEKGLTLHLKQGVMDSQLIIASNILAALLLYTLKFMNIF